jgi:hypothetical protein
MELNKKIYCDKKVKRVLNLKNVNEIKEREQDLEMCDYV